MSRVSGFSSRHIGPSEQEQAAMLSALGLATLDDLVHETVPQEIRLESELDLPEAMSEADALAELSGIMNENLVLKSLIGQGYYGTLTPPVIQRNILENPGWYTAYTPYQAEIAQGRLEALLNFQTMVCDLTGLAVANASLLDEGTAAAEAMTLALSSKRNGKTMFVSDGCHPQTISVLQTRAEPLGISLVTGKWQEFAPEEHEGFFAALVQYPDTEGRVENYTAFTRKVHESDGVVIAATDLLALTLLKPPGEWGADIAVGNSQRFGVPLGYGGPHAAFISCTDKLKRKLPGRLIGISKDSQGKPAYRLALQTREQHIRRDKATSNICTAQVLLAVMASMYAVYHGPDGLKAIAQRVNAMARRFAAAVGETCLEVEHDAFFDTVVVVAGDHADELAEAAEEAGFNLHRLDAARLSLSFDETVTEDEFSILLDVFAAAAEEGDPSIPVSLLRESSYLTHSVFQSYYSETEMLRYLKRLESKDLALNESMIPLGSCTMKLNATAEMIPVSWPEVGQIHPFAPQEQVVGYFEMITQLSHWLAEITGFAAVSLQPNAGSQGEYAGLLAIRRFHLSQKGRDRTVCLIPMSAHGTNPASAVMAGFSVVGVACDSDGNIDVKDLLSKCEKYSDQLGALMVTYPSTHGVFEETIIEMCDLIHQHGGQVYMDGANMNAQVGLTSPGYVGADVCHLNLHKTFCIPHGGGGPGVGPIGVASHLVEFLPGHDLLEDPENAVCSAPFGSASINVISWMYIAMMGAKGLINATEVAILNANYVAHRLQPHFPVLYKGKTGRVAHECIIDIRPLAAVSGITVEDVAKRLTDYGYHSPTMSWPVAGTLMIEPTESESKVELDKFCDAMISIHAEIVAIINGEYDRNDNPLKNAPHTAEMVTAEEWLHSYGRQTAAYPVESLRLHKFWPSVGRVDNVHGDRNLICTCEPMESYNS